MEKKSMFQNVVSEFENMSLFDINYESSMDELTDAICFVVINGKLVPIDPAGNLFIRTNIPDKIVCCPEDAGLFDTNYEAGEDRASSIDEGVGFVLINGELVEADKVGKRSHTKVSPTIVQ